MYIQEIGYTKHRERQRDGDRQTEDRQRPVVGAVCCRCGGVGIAINEPLIHRVCIESLGGQFGLRGVGAVGIEVTQHYYILCGMKSHNLLI